MSTEKLISLLANLPILAVAIYALGMYRTYFYRIKIICWYIFLSGIIQLAGVGLWLYGINNMPLLHAYVAMGGLCLIYFYHSVIGAYLARWALLIVGGVFLLATLINSIFVQGILTFNSYALTLEAALVIVLSLSTYSLMMSGIFKEQQRALLNSLGWINSGLFIYFSSDLLLFYFGDWLTYSVQLSDEEFQQTWVLHAFFTVVMYVCFFIGLWKSPRR